MQYACQRHYFGAMAETYFDNKVRDASTNVRHQQKTIEAFNRLPEEFTAQDVMNCFGMTLKSTNARISRLLKDRLAEKKDEYLENGTKKAIYKKIANIIL